VSSVGAYLAAASFLVFLYAPLRTLTAGERVGANPWSAGATTFAWRVSSPPPFHSFEELPRVR
jgi:cytochrome c oxidase subunit 1